MQLVLASGSPRRRELLAVLGVPFIVRESNVPEVFSPTLTPAENAMSLARQKAEAVARELSYDAAVIGADTIVVLEGEIFGKPQDAEDARRMLRFLSGKTHEVITGLCVTDGQRQTLMAYERTEVTFADLSENEITAYLATGEPLDKAGAYGIQGPAAAFISRICGCYFNVVGLPLYRLTRMLRAFGMTVLE